MSHTPLFDAVTAEFQRRERDLARHLTRYRAVRKVGIDPTFLTVAISEAVCANA